MQQISSRSLYLYKRVFPAFWFGVLALFLVGPILGHAPKPPIQFFFAPLVMAVIGYVVMKKLVWDLADQVFDCGDHLLVKRRGEEDIVPLGNIMNVSASLLMRPPRVTLNLVNPGKFGTEINFSPVTPFSLNPFAKNAVVDDLITRAYKARVMRDA
jgi:hypothetical protein